MGLTLDTDKKYVYWIVRGSEGSNLFRAPMAGYSDSKIQAEKISSLQKSNMQGLLCYFHMHLLWLQDDRNAAISDMQGKNIATISGKSMSDLTLVYVVDSSLHVTPGKWKRKTFEVTGSYSFIYETTKNVNTYFLIVLLS